MDASQQAIADGIKGCLLLGAPPKGGRLPPQHFRQGARHESIVRQILSRNDKEAEDPPQLVNVVWRDEVPDGIQVLQGKVRTFLVHPEPEELRFAITESCLCNAQGDGVLGADAQEAFEVFYQLLDVIAVADPIVNLVPVPASLHLRCCRPIRSLGFCATIFLPKRQGGGLHQSQGRPDCEGLA